MGSEMCIRDRANAARARARGRGGCHGGGRGDRARGGGHHRARLQSRAGFALEKKRGYRFETKAETLRALVRGAAENATRRARRCGVAYARDHLAVRRVRSAVPISRAANAWNDASASTFFFQPFPSQDRAQSASRATRMFDLAANVRNGVFRLAEMCGVYGNLRLSDHVIRLGICDIYTLLLTKKLCGSCANVSSGNASNGRLRSSPETNATLR